MMQAVIGVVSVRSLDNRQPVEETLGYLGQAAIGFDFLDVLELFLEGVVIIYTFKVDRMLATCEDHVHDNADGPHVNTLGVLLATSHFWGHEGQGAAIFIF